MRVLRWTGWIAAGVVLLLLITILALRFLVPTERLRDEAITRAEAATGYDVDLAEIHLGLSWSGLALRSGAIVIANPGLTEAAGARFLTLERLEVGVALWPLLRRQVEVTHLVLVGPELELRRDASGRMNIELAAARASAAASAAGAAAVTSGAPPAASAGVLLAVPEARIVDARFRLIDEFEVTRVELGDLDGTLHVALEPEVIRLSGELAARELTARLGGEEPVAYGPYDLGLDFDLAYRLAAGRLTVRQAELTLAAIQLAVTGTVDSLRSNPLLDLTLETGRFEPARVLSLVPAAMPAELELAGTAALTARVRGALPATVVQGSLTLESVAVTVAGMDGPLVTGLDGAIEFTQERATIAALRGDIPGGHFALTGSVTDFAAPELTVEFELDTDLAELAGLVHLPPGLVLESGRVAARIDARTRAPEFLPGLVLGGTIDLRDVRGQVPGLATGIAITRCPIRLRGRSITIESLALAAGRSDLGGRVAVDDLLEPLVQFQLESRLLDLDAMFPPTTVEVEEGAARADGRLSGDDGDDAGDGTRGGTGQAAEAVGPPALVPPMDGTVAAGELHYRGLSATDVRLRVLADAAGLRIEEVYGRLLGGELTGAAQVRLVTPDSLHYSSTLKVKGVEANQLLSATTPIRDLIYGTLDADLDLSGMQTPGAEPLSLLNVNGNTALSTGHLRVAGGLGRILTQLGVADGEQLDFDELVSKLVIRQGRVQLDHGKMLSGKHGDYHFGGSVGFDRTLAVDVEGLIPARYLPREVTRSAELVELLSDDRGRIPLGFTIGGTLDRPTIQLDLGRLQEQFRTSLQQQTTRALKEQATDKVNQLLDSLFKRKKKD